MRRKKHEEEEHENSERWLLSYADFMTLLMIFFVVMYSMSNVDSEKYKNVTAGLNAIMGGGTSFSIMENDGGGVSIVPGDGEGKATDAESMTEEQKLEEVKSNVDQYLEDSTLSDSVETSIEERGLVLSFKDALLFESGKVVLKPEQTEKLTEIGRILNQSLISESYIRVEGHTDNVPIENNIYKSNWDLSVIRASNVAQLLIDQSEIAPERVSVVGYGEYRPKGDNSTEEGKIANRRVDVIIMNSEFNEVENNKS